MNYAIIAAGEGSRLAQEGVKEPKPLVRIRGERLIDRLMRIFMANDAENIKVICNDHTALVGAHLLDIQENGLQGRRVPLDFVVKSTPSSMHSFFELSSHLPDAPFILTTVDTIFREDEFTDYVTAFRESLGNGFDGLMGVTDYVDDESPLYVGTDSGMNITGFYDDSHNCRYISGGIYGLDFSAIATLKTCMARGESRMRNFQRGLISDGRRLKAYKFSKVMDIDHAADIVKAEEWLSVQ